MIHARKTGFWRSSYALSVDGRPLVDFDARAWRTGGGYTYGGARYEVRANTWGSRYELTGPDGAVLAVAERVNRKRPRQAEHSRGRGKLSTAAAAAS